MEARPLASISMKAIDFLVQGDPGPYHRGVPMRRGPSEHPPFVGGEARRAWDVPFEEDA
jgi:hypothetical protein